MACY